MRLAPVLLRRQVRQRHGLAELLETDCRKSHRHENGLEAAPSPDRSPLRTVWRASGTRVRRRAAAHGLALLHQFRRAEFCAGLGSLAKAIILLEGDDDGAHPPVSKMCEPSRLGDLARPGAGSRNRAD